MLTVAGMVWYKGFPWQLALAVALVCLGFGLDAIAETFFVDLRVKRLAGQRSPYQDRRIRARLWLRSCGNSSGSGTGLDKPFSNYHFVGETRGWHLLLFQGLRLRRSGPTCVSGCLVAVSGRGDFRTDRDSGELWTTKPISSSSKVP